MLHIQIIPCNEIAHQSTMIHTCTLLYNVDLYFFRVFAIIFTIANKCFFLQFAYTHKLQACFAMRIAQVTHNLQNEWNEEKMSRIFFEREVCAMDFTRSLH